MVVCGGILRELGCFFHYALHGGGLFVEGAGCGHCGEGSEVEGLCVDLEDCVLVCLGRIGNVVSSCGSNEVLDYGGVSS